jgi:sialidase-1
MDEFRLYRQALSTAQLDQLRTTNAAVLDGDPAAAANRALGVRLPFQVVDAAATPARVSVASTDDNSGHCAAGTLLGGKLAAAGHVGTGALAVNSAHPGVEVPFLPALDVSSGDFSFTAWFQYAATASTPQQAIVWAYGSTGGQRAVWIRAQPAQDRLFAWVQTDTGQVSVAVPDPSDVTAFGDDAWHLLALTRSGDRIQFSVDGAAPAVATGLTGTLTANQAAGIEGLRLGAKPDGSDVLSGNLDEFRLYHRALTGAELADITAKSHYPGDIPAVWWSFESMYTQTHDVVRPAPASGPATPDSSAHCNEAYVRGGATPVAGKFGSALSFDGVDDAVQIPMSASTALGSSDFTISSWLKYTASPGTADQVILWAYGVGAAERQIWLRAEPAQDRLFASFETDAATVTVAAPDASPATAFGNGAWHHVALQRSGGYLQLIVDGVTLGSAAAPAGAVTYGDTFAVDGFQLGAKPDGTGRFKGALDEFRIFRKALSAQELADVRISNTDPGTVTAVRLPFDLVTTEGYAL